MAVLERVAERLLLSSFVDLGTGTLGSSMYLIFPNVVSASITKMRVKEVILTVVSSCTGTQRNETLTNVSQLHVWI